MNAGYSGTPLARKLGFKEGMRVVYVNPPAGFAVEGIEDVRSRLTRGTGLVVFFTRERRLLERRIGALRRAIEPDGMLWIAWPKRASGIDTDLSFEAVQEIGLAGGLVDNKSCAIDDDWQAVRFVIRVRDRTGK